MDPYPFQLIKPLPDLHARWFKPDIQGPGVGGKSDLLGKLLHIGFETHVIPALSKTGDDGPLEDELFPPAPKYPAVICLLMPQYLLPTPRNRDILTIGID